MLLPVLAPISLAVQLWNSLPSFRQVRNAIPRSFGDLCRIPSAIWNSIPSLNQLLNMLVNLIRAMVRDYTTRLSPQVTGQSTRQPALWFLSIKTARTSHAVTHSRHHRSEATYAPLIFDFCITDRLLRQPSSSYSRRETFSFLHEARGILSSISSQSSWSPKMVWCSKKSSQLLGDTILKTCLWFM